MTSTKPSKQDIIDSIIKKLFVQFRFNFEYLGNIPSDPFCPYKFLLEAKNAGAKNLDGSEIKIPKDGSDPFGLDRVCHLNSYFAYGHPAKPYIFKDDGYMASNHITDEAFTIMYGMFLFDFLKKEKATPLIFPTDYNFYEEGLTKQFLISKKYEHGPHLPIYHKLHADVFTKKYFKAMGNNQHVLDLKYDVDSFPPELKDSIVTINFSLTMLYNIILVESAFVDLFGYKRMKRKFDLLKAIDQDKNAPIQEKNLLLAYLLSCLHPFAYVVAYGIFRNRYGMRNDQPITKISPHGTFYFDTDAARQPFKEVLQKAIKEVIKYKHDKRSLSRKEKQTLLWLSAVYGIGYHTTLERFSKNHIFNKVDYNPKQSPDKTFTNRAIKNSPLWRTWYKWWGSYWRRKNMVAICRNKPGTIKKHASIWDKELSSRAIKLKFDFIYKTSKTLKNLLLKQINDPNYPEERKIISRKKLEENWDIK